MAQFPVEVFTHDQALLGHNDRYKSALLNRKNAVWPKGVYIGFDPVVADPLITLDPDATESISVIHVPSSDDVGALTIAVDRTLTLDFTGVLPGDFPVHVLARATYTDAPDTPTTAEVFTRSAGVVAADEVLICVVDGPVGSLTVDVTPSLARQTPLAFADTSYGFMPTGSIEDLQAAADAVNEVIASRLGLDGVTYPSLKERLDADYGATNMATRLARVLRVIRGNSFTIPAATTTTTLIGGSLSEANRDYLPARTFDGLGSETADGAVAGPNDAQRNVLLLVNALTGNKAVTNDTDRTIVFARLTGPVMTLLTGTVAYQNAQVAVSGSGTQFTAELVEGDLIEGVDGLFYEIQTIADDETMTLRNGYIGATAQSDGRSSRRWQLELFTLSGGVEVTASFDADTTVIPYLPVFVDRSVSVADWALPHHTPAERPPLPSATTTDAGRALLGTTGARVGAVFIQHLGAPVAGSPFHTINFVDGNGQVIEDPLNAGELDVGEIGIAGADGGPGPQGGPGPPGDPGPGFTEKTAFIAGSLVTVTGGAGSVAISYSEAMGHTVRYASGGFANIQAAAGSFGWVFSTDYAEITGITIAGNLVQISGNVTSGGGGNGVSAQVFASSAGD